MDSKIKLVENEQEYQNVLDIRRIVFIDEQGVPESLEIDQNEKNATYFLASYHGRPVTTGRIRENKNIVKFERIATLPDYRGLGLGRLLMDFMQKYCLKKYPHHILMMNAQESAISFYTQLGWKPDGDYFIEADIKHQKLTFTLS